MKGNIDNGERLSIEESKLNDLKRFIENRINEIEKEIALWKALLEIIERRIQGEVVKSFEKHERVPEREYYEALRGKSEKLVSEIFDERGILLAKIYERNGEIVVRPSSKVKVRIESKEFKQFFIRKVLGGIKRENPNFKYKIFDRSGILIEIILKNIANDREKRRIQGAIKWTFKKFLI